MNPIQMNIQSEEDIERAMFITKNIAEELGYQFKNILQLQLVTEEACTNAYEHCIREGFDSYQVTWNITADSFEIYVTQPGSMFPIIQKEEVILGLRGRGLILMFHIMDKVVVRQQGEYTELYMVKEREESLSEFI
ncbi:ATP-binding protein [Litchfieldia salsa]|uniref:Serine/threonine-protein kinase RsbW n=1 Tax=Litchfieldia salsa TaxID=930152 RepID=A0A1H0WWA6_9BACI|nr:ATP-binding protein [Litchfieldia salsa]SDP95003.1 serine/threonine-protein kinase RsbW [Litchfieldia salsa]